MMTSGTRTRLEKEKRPQEEATTNPVQPVEELLN